MKTLTLDTITKGQNWVGLGIAGNQAQHLDQAGEADDFKDVVALENAPKGMFPWYIPGSESFLGDNPISSSELRLNGSDPLQPEPEIALVVQFDYAESGSLLNDLSVLGFTVFNDCSRRIAADKISMKKNWGAASQGMTETIVPINDFASVDGVIGSYRLCCFLERNGQLLPYGKDTAVADYCYFNDTLVRWIVQQINTQQDQGPLENLSSLLADSKPKYGVIGIGATCYTDFGNSDERFLQAGDQVIVAAYDSEKHSAADLEALLCSELQSSSCGSLLILKQSVL